MDISSINAYLKYEKADWKIQRVSWILMGLFLLIGILGGFGGSRGVLNVHRITSGNYTVEYDRFVRVEKAFKTKVLITGNNLKNQTTVSVNKGYLDKVQITQVIPDPEEVEISTEKIIYRFNSKTGGTISFFCEPTAMGSQYLNLIINEKSVSVKQFIYF